jgi:hypothetical protein
MVSPPGRAQTRQGPGNLLDDWRQSALGHQFYEVAVVRTILVTGFCWFLSLFILGLPLAELTDYSQSTVSNQGITERVALMQFDSVTNYRTQRGSAGTFKLLNP